MANSQLSEKKWKYVSLGLMAVLALGFSFPQAFAHVTSDMKHGIEHVIALLNGIDTKVTDIQAKVNSGTSGLQAIKTSVDNLPGRTITFTNLQLDLGEDYEILPARSGLAYGIYVDITVSGLEGNEIPVIFCSGAQGVGLQNGVNTLDLACDELTFSRGLSEEEITATVNGKIRYQNLFESNHDELWAGTPSP